MNTLTTGEVATVRAEADEYVSDRQLDASNLGADRQFARYEGRLDFAEGKLGEIRPVIEGAFVPEPDHPQTPGYDPNTPPITADSVIPPAEIASEAQSVADLVALSVANREARTLAELARNGYAPSSRMGEAVSATLRLQAAALSEFVHTGVALGASEANAKQLGDFCPKALARADRLNKIAIAAQENRSARQAGFISAIPRATSVSRDT